MCDASLDSVVSMGGTGFAKKWGGLVTRLIKFVFWYSPNEETIGASVLRLLYAGLKFLW